MPLIDLANPSRFLAFVDRVLPWLVGATVLAFAIGIDQAYFAPDDYQQGATVKIMFIHVPSAWLSMMAWGLMSMAALGTLVWRHPLADVAAKTAAPIGAWAGAFRRDATRSGRKCTAVASVTTSVREPSLPATVLCTCSDVPCGSVV